MFVDGGVGSSGDGREPAGPARVAEVLAMARAAMAEVLAADLSRFVDAALTEHVLDVVSLGEQVQAAAVLAAGPWAARKTFTGDGFGSPRALLAARTTLGSGAASRLASTGRFVFDHDTTAEALRDGRLPVASVAAMAANSGGARGGLFDRDEAALVGHAGRLDVDSFAKVMRRWRALADDALADADTDAVHHARSAHGSFVGTNGYRLDANLEATDGALVDTALRHAMGKADPVEFPGGARTAEQRRADALVELARRYLESVNTNRGTEPAAPTVTVGVRVDWTVLTGTSDDACDPTLWCDLFSAIPVGRNTMRRLLCDSWAGRIITAGRSLALDLGANTRYFTPAQRLALIARDGDTCVVPGCTVPAERCEAHHIEPYDNGGPTDLDNGAHLCSFHHHKVHEGHWTLKRHPDGRWTFTKPPPVAHTPPTAHAPPRHSDTTYPDAA